MDEDDAPECFTSANRFHLAHCYGSLGDPYDWTLDDWIAGLIEIGKIERLKAGEDMSTAADKAIESAQKAASKSRRKRRMKR